MRLLLSLLLISFIFLSIAERPQAFDDTTSIEPSHHVQENFLDLKEYQFHKLQEERWYESQNGWSTSGGSISVDLHTIISRSNPEKTFGHGFLPVSI